MRRVAWPPRQRSRTFSTCIPSPCGDSLGVLRAEGIVESRSGPKGGWAIARDPARISLAALYRALADEEPDVVSPAALDEAIEAAEAAYVTQLEPVTLASLLDEHPND